MIYSGIRPLCAISMLCGLALSILPESGVKRVTEIVCTASLILAILSPVKELSFDDYALESAKLHEIEQELSANAEEVSSRLNRLVIEKEYETYIMDKANELGISIIEAEVESQWSLDGLWLPYEAKIKADCTSEEQDKLSAMLVTELGIPYERQQWSSE